VQLQSSNVRTTAQSLPSSVPAETAVARLAARDYEDAGSTFVATVRRLFPMGADVHVALGSERVALRITGHSTVRPGIVYGRDATNVERQFSAGVHDAQVIR
jgi:hypothetical protein